VSGGSGFINAGDLVATWQRASILQNSAAPGVSVTGKNSQTKEMGRVYLKLANMGGQ
jgi:hypothetical protein